MRKQPLDELDLRIVNELQKDSNITNLKLSETVGLSPAATLKRVKTLHKRGFIHGYKAIVNLKQFGFTSDTLVLIKVLTENQDRLRSKLLASQFAINVFETEGVETYSDTTVFCLTLLSDSDNSVEDIVSGFCNTVRVVEVQIFHSARLIKDDKVMLTNIP